MKEALTEFILEHENDDTSRLLLSAKTYPLINIRLAVSTIEARKKIKNKVPEWYAHPEIIYPLSLSVEQCSSEWTAAYKQRFISSGAHLCDITGGMGVDSYYLSKIAESLDYFERNTELYEAALHNFKILEADNITGHNTEINPLVLEQMIQQKNHYDLIYADPARRSAGGSRIFSISECEPDITQLKNQLFQLTDHLLVKISPMADLSHTLEEIPEVKEIHVIAFGNECKEILLLIEKGYANEGDSKIHTINFTGKKEESFNFHLSEEKNAHAFFYTRSKEELVNGYLYEPNKALMKSGAFKIISEKLELEKLASASHLYYSQKLLIDFPGRSFKIDEVRDLNKANLKSFHKDFPSSSVSAKNIPMTSDELRKKLKIKENDIRHTFGTTLYTGERVLIVATKII